MPGIENTNVIGRREWVPDLLFLADHVDTVATSMIRKSKPSKDEKTGIPNSIEGTYYAEAYGDIKAGGVADGADVKAFDASPQRDAISFRPEKYRRAPMVGDLASDDVVAGLSSEWDHEVAKQIVMHKRDIEKEVLSANDSSLNGGAEGGTVMRGLESWISSSASGWSEKIVPVGVRTPAAQIYTGVIGDGMTTGLTEDVAQALFKSRWDNTGDSSKLVGLLGTDIKDRFALFTKYKPALGSATVIVRTMTDAYTSNDLNGAAVDVYMSDYGGSSLIPVPTRFLTDAKTGFFLDMGQVELRSRYWMREKPLPDLGGGPRKLIESFIALLPGDPRTHIKIDAS
jgi:hypothetical protein